MAFRRQVRIFDSCYNKLVQLCLSPADTKVAALFGFSAGDGLGAVSGFTATDTDSDVLDGGMGAVLGFIGIERDSDVHDAILHLSGGVDLLCLVNISTTTFSNEQMKEKLTEARERLGLQDHKGSRKMMFLNVDTFEDAEGGTLFHETTYESEPFTFVPLPKDALLENTVVFRIQANIEMLLNFLSQTEFFEAVDDAITAALDSICSTDVAFHISNSKILVSRSTNGISVSGPVQRQCRVADIIPHINTTEVDNSLKGSKNKRKRNTTLETIVDVNILQRLSDTHSSDERHVPVVQYDLCDSKAVNVKLQLPVDITVNFPSDCHIASMYQHFCTAVQRQMVLMKNCLIENFKEHGVVPVKPYLYRIPGFASLIQIVYPYGIEDSQLVSQRTRLHSLFALTMERPILRTSNAFLFKPERNEIYLQNVHEGLSHSKDGTVAIVYGKYAYHHYMQDHFDDNHWGCAYRSLQTLCSWFRLQGYINRPVPSHREIQQTLVDVGDKPPKFVGTKEWIGSIEVSTVLNQLFNVTSRIMFVSSGAELAHKGRELLQHFQTHGTPVMIGGGSYAHTILGVDFSEVTGDLKFLVLDPHYTGEENSKTIISKGWCGWKKLDFWDAGVFYNLCLPQRPIEI